MCSGEDDELLVQGRDELGDVGDRCAERGQRGEHRVVLYASSELDGDGGRDRPGGRGMVRCGEYERLGAGARDRRSSTWPGRAAEEVGRIVDNLGRARIVDDLAGAGIVGDLRRRRSAGDRRYDGRCDRRVTGAVTGAAPSELAAAMSPALSSVRWPIWTLGSVGTIVSCPLAENAVRG